jgi:signal transduction histidine kinase
MLNPIQSLLRGRFNPIRAMILCVGITLAIFGVLGYNLHGMYTSFNKLVDVDFTLTRLTGKVVYLDELLTMSARLAVTTGDLRWQKRWSENLEPIDTAIKQANQIDQTAFQTEGAEQTQKANDRLAELETEAMETLNRGGKKAAQDIMFSTEYEENKKLHKGGMEKINQSIDERLARQIEEVNRKLIVIAVLLATSLGLMMIAWIGVIYLVKKHEAQQQTIIASERKAKEAQEEVVKQLQEMDKLKDNFLANTSHELRTPLNGIIGLAESMADGATGPITEVQRENLDMIVSSGRRLANLVNDILDFSKLKHKDIELSLKTVDMRSLANVVLQFSRSLVAGKKLKLVNSIEPGAPHVYGDENRLQQILINLVGNAIKFSEHGTVEITAKQSGDMLEVSISDQGIGIPADKFDRIFESFEQADGSTARQYGGTGIGLAITRKMVELHKGTIRVESVVGKGSTFTFTMPISTEEVAAAPEERIHGVEAEPEDLLPELAETEDVPVPAAAASISKDASAPRPEAPQIEASVLIVDDEPVNLQVLANHLTLYGYRVEKAASGVEAAERIGRGEKFDLILLDVMMPRMSGYELCQIVRDKYPASELPIVLLTAKNQTSDLVVGFESGANDYLTKPVNKQELDGPREDAPSDLARKRGLWTFCPEGIPEHPWPREHRGSEARRTDHAQHEHSVL